MHGDLSLYPHARHAIVSKRSAADSGCGFFSPVEIEGNLPAKPYHALDRPAGCFQNGAAQSEKVKEILGQSSPYGLERGTGKSLETSKSTSKLARAMGMERPRNEENSVGMDPSFLSYALRSRAPSPSLPIPAAPLRRSRAAVRRRRLRRGRRRGNHSIPPNPPRSWRNGHGEKVLV